MTEQTQTPLDSRHVVGLVLTSNENGDVRLELNRPPLSEEQKGLPPTIAEICATTIMRLWQTGTLTSLVGTVCPDLVRSNPELQAQADEQEKQAKARA